MSNSQITYCSYGCDKPAIFWFKNGKGCCSKYAMHCPARQVKRRASWYGGRNSFSPFWSGEKREYKYFDTDEIWDSDLGTL